MRINRLLIGISVLLCAVTGSFSQPVIMHPPIHVIHPVQQISPFANPAGFSPSQIRAAYNLPTTGGIGTIAIIDAYDDTSAQNDFNIFSSQFGLLTATTTNFEIHKMSSSIALATTDNWALEISLDIEWSHAIAPNAKILLVEAVSPNDTDLLSAVQYAAGRSDVVAVSMSWGGNEFSGSQTYDSYFTSSYGASFFASSGDSGTGVEWPAVSVNVTGVGGTQLTLSASTTVTSEVAWSGSGGGLSQYISEPSYQSTYGIPSANGFRGVPDVSYNGSSNSPYAVYDSLGETGWIEVYGTSAGSPQWAAIRALGGSLVNNTTFYNLAAIHSYYTTDFRDITSGSNGSNGIYTKATTGYDYVTGLGSPLTDNFSAAPSANFVGNPTTGNGPYTVNFTDSTLFYPTGWNWTFGDGSTSTSENPSHTYAAVTSPKYYTVQLIATNSYGTSTLIRTNYIFVTEPSPTAGFYGTPTSGASPLTVNFTDTSGNSPTAWLWQFGDGSTSNSQNPSHTYISSTSATYSVTLIVSNSFGTSTGIKSNYIKVTPPPVAGFYGTPTSGASPLTVNFTDTSANNPTGWQWTFGDGSTSTNQNPSHTYISSTVATYTVRLIVTNSLGTSTSTLTNYIKVSPPPIAGFFGSPTNGISPLMVNFTDTSANNPTEWQWSFGDGSTSTIQNPSHTYITATSATFTVRLIVTNSLGTSTSTRTNYISVTPPPPVAGFYGSPTSGISPLNVNFMDTSANNPTAWAWSFGDGSTSNLENPTHTYTTFTSASYTVTLIASNSLGTSTSILTNYIQVTPPPPSAGFYGSPTSGISPLNVNFMDTSTNNPTSWAWSFGDGSTSNSQNPTHTYSSPSVATYTVTLMVTNSFGTSTSILTNYIKVTPPPPTIGFFGSPTSGISPLNVNFMDTSTNNPTAWAWSFGDGSTSNSQNPSHQYTTSSSASYTVTLIASNSFGTSTGVYTNYIQVTPPPPVAEFYGTPTSGTFPLIVNFTDTSLNNPTSWSWNFGDGSTANIQNPAHTYGIVSSPTSYTVQLIVSNSFGTSTLIRANYINVQPPPPFAGFFGTPTSGYGALTVNFTDTTLNNPTGWNWNFGDGASTTLQNPQHIYSTVTTPTSYTVQLIATNSYGTTTAVRSNYILVTEPPPTAGFSFNPLNGFGPLTVNFVDTSANNPTSWSWSFGDGAVTTIQSPTHIYQTVSMPTSYSIRLIVMNAFGTSTSTQTISISEPVPIAGFNGIPTSGNGPLTVNFTDTSINYYGSATSWTWNFGDGSTSNSQNPSHQYATVGASTSYTVRLIVTTNFGTSTATQTNYISVSEPSPSAGFSVSSSSGYGPLNVNFTDTSANLFGSSTTWSWDFGDGVSTTVRNPQHTYNVVNVATTYTVRLIVSTNFGASTATQTISVTEPPPSAGFSGTPTSGTGPLTVNFTDTTANLFGTSTIYAWNFGDGSTSNLRNPSHTYATVSSPTSYTVNLIVTTNFGVGTATVPNYISIAQLPPTAGFSASPLNGYAPLTVNFTDTSGFSPTAWSWNFGDGNTDNSQNPQHIYGTVTTPTSYTVRLIASNSFGSSTATQNNLISVSEPVPSVPNLLSPADSSALYRISVLFSWTSSTDIVNSSMNYNIQMARDTGFVSIVTTISNVTVTNPTITGLPPGPLEWHVQATSVFGTSGYSSTQLVTLFDTSDRQPVTSSETSANFFVGDTTGVYLPVMMVFNTVSPDTITVTTFDTTAMGLPPGGHFIPRYWRINRMGTDTINVNLTFSYTSADFAASGLSSEGSLYAVRDTSGPGGWSAVTTGISVDTVNHRLTITNINPFADWTLGNLVTVPVNDWWEYSADINIPKRE